MFIMMAKWVKSLLQGVFGGFLGSGVYYAIVYLLGCYPIIGTFAPLIAVVTLVIVSYFGLKLFFKYASFSTIYNYLSFFGGSSIGGIIGWIVWGVKNFC